MTPEDIKERYEGRILNILVEIMRALRKAHFRCSYPYDFDGDECFRWGMEVGKHSRARYIEVSFIIAESKVYDGSENGVNFMVDIVGKGGEIVGGLCPFNYTDAVWVNLDDENAIEERFTLLERADPEGVVECIRAWMERR